VTAVALAAVDEGTGPAVVLLHAFPCSSDMWRAQREGLLAAGWRVITPDLRGFGDSPLGDHAPSLDAMADDVLALLDSLALDRIVLGGLSMGGYVSMALLRRRPEVVAGVILADTKATADPPAGRENRERIARAVLEAGSAGAVLREAVVPALLGETSVRERPDVVARVEEFVDAADPAAVAWAQRAMAQRPDSLPTLAETRVPALVLWGEEDALSPRPDAEAMLRALPRGSGVEIARAGHLSAIEQPAAVTAALLDFVEPLRGPFM
jgi:pimeloyl-ACP methyl ester carboxylesterase